MGRQQQVRARNGRGDEVAIQTHDTDAPMLPVNSLRELHEFRPDLVDFVVTQTEKEADFRRSSVKRINVFVLIERLFGMFCAVFIGVFGIIGGGYVGLHGQPILGGTIATAALGTLAVAFIKKNQTQNSNGGKQNPPRK
jgi:hypothetical protein